MAIRVQIFAENTGFPGFPLVHRRVGMGWWGTTLTESDHENGRKIFHTLTWELSTRTRHLEHTNTHSQHAVAVGA